TIHDAATGKLGLYFRHTSGICSVAYFDTQVQRTRLSLVTDGDVACAWIGRSTEPENLDLAVTVGDGNEPDSCNVVIESSSRGLVETWKNLPRDASRAVGIINGTKSGSYDLAQASVNVASLGLRAGSLLLRALPTQAGTRLENGNATVTTPGRASGWFGDGPGQALGFGGQDLLTTTQAEAATLPRKLTVEAWVRPETNSETSSLVVHSDGETAYNLGLQVVGGGHYPVVGVKTDIDLPWQWRMGQQRLPAGQWHHLVLRFEQSYALRFNSRSYLAVAHAEALDLASDLTIELGLWVENLNGNQLLISKGSPSTDGAESLPYCLLLDTQGRLVFTFESEQGEAHSFTSKTRLTPGFHRVAVTRKAGRSEHQTSHSQGLNYQSSDGQPLSMPSQMVETMAADPWHEITFYVDGQRDTPYRYDGQSPIGNAAPLLIGGDGRGRHLSGTLCEIRLWKVAREAKSVGRTVGRRERGLVAWWTLEEGRGNMAYDARGSHHGKLTGAQWVKSPDPQASRVELWHNGLPTPSRAPTPAQASELGGGPLAQPQPQLSLAGIAQNGAIHRGLAGSLEEVRIWRTKRTPEQVVDNLFCRLKGESQDLLAYYPFDGASTSTEATSVHDHSLRGLHLTWPSEAAKPAVQVSSAPIGHDMPGVRSTLAGIDTAFHLRVSTAAAVEEYGDLQEDEHGNTFGVLKRAYSYLQEGRWQLFTGYKVGNLRSEWIGQAQFDPQVVGYLEGIPPVPSENMTEGQMDPRTMNWADIGLMAGVEVTESDSVTYTLGSSTEGSQESAFEASAEFAFDNDFLISIAPLGFGKVVKALEVEASAGVKGSFETAGGWANEARLGTTVNRTRTLSASMGGGWESPDPSEQLNPGLGRRLLVGNAGFALVQSETADIYALRLQHNNALVSFRMVPNPDIPKDWNVISFPINPLYTKQGTLDGRIGFNEQGAPVYDPDYANAEGYGEYSYFKPREAYALRRRIQLDEQRRLHYFATKGVDEKRFKSNKLGAVAGQAASLMLKELNPDVADMMQSAQRSMGDSGTTFKSLPAQHAKRNLVNTYVWTADGGFYKEETATTDIRTESASGNF
ncbi:MAG: LamG-like jellyroll fold domain-containing protein, partial [Nannocystaceae bacterium]